VISFYSNFTTALFYAFLSSPLTDNEGRSDCSN